MDITVFALEVYLVQPSNSNPPALLIFHRSEIFFLLVAKFSKNIDNPCQWVAKVLQTTHHQRNLSQTCYEILPHTH